VTVAESVLGVPATQGRSVMVPREPLVGTPVANVSSQVSASEPVRVMVMGVFSLVETVFGSAVGGLYVGLTVMETVAGEEDAVPSLVV